MVKFPLTGFDLSTWHLSNCSNGCIRDGGGLSSKNGSLSRKSTKSNSKSGTLTKNFLHEDHRYDLYAVCYHQGDTLETGHYTAACKNPYDQQWYKFDDQRVTSIKIDEVPDRIINNEAYMLFYQRRKANESSDSSGASTSSGEHWVSKIATVPSNLTQKSKTQEASTSSFNTPILPPETENDQSISALIVEDPIHVPKPIEIVEEEDTGRELEAIFNIDDIRAIDSDDIPEMISSCETEDHKTLKISEHSKETNTNQNLNPIKEKNEEDEEDDEEETKENNNTDDLGEMSEKEDEKEPKQKIEVKVEISNSSPLPENENEEALNREMIRNERDKLEDLMSQHKISNLLWNDQNNNHSNNNRHSDIGAITISDLLLMDRIEDISSTSLPKNYMLHDTERITNRIRGANSCSKDTLMYIDQQGLLDDDPLLENRSHHWVSLALLNI